MNTALVVAGAKSTFATSIRLNLLYVVSQELSTIYCQQEHQSIYMYIVIEPNTSKSALLNLRYM